MFCAAPDDDDDDECVFVNIVAARGQISKKNNYQDQDERIMIKKIPQWNFKNENPTNHVFDDIVCLILCLTVNVKGDVTMAFSLSWSREEEEKKKRI